MLNRNNSIQYISLFSGAGGLDLGLQYAGFERLLAVEQCSNSVATLIKNGSPTETILNKKIEDCSSTEIQSFAKTNKIESIDLLVGGPPCQPFSKSSFWLNGDTRRMQDPRANTLIELMRVIRDLKPKNVLIENVIGIKYKQKDEGYVYICEQFEKINRETGTKYRLSVNKINAADYGIPQKRERVFIIANLDGKEFNLPPATHGNNSKNKKIVEYVTTWDAIGDLENLKHSDLNVTNKWGDLLPSIPEGSNYLWHTSRMGGEPLFGWRTRYWSFLLKLDKNLPSWTITANPGSANGPFHWKNRKLSIREMARIQTFPDSYSFEGTYSQVRVQIGNAVPPLLAEFLGNEIRTQLIDGKKTKPLQLSISRNLLTPESGNLDRVAEKYLELKGVHKDHPGTGKGPGVIQR